MIKALNLSGHAQGVNLFVIPDSKGVLIVRNDSGLLIFFYKPDTLWFVGQL